MLIEYTTTLALSFVGMTGFFLMLWAAVGFIKIKKFFGSAPKDIQDAVLIPIVTIFFAFFFPGEKITLQGGISSAVTIAGLFVSEIRFSK